MLLHIIFSRLIHISALLQVIINKEGKKGRRGEREKSSLPRRDIHFVFVQKLAKAASDDVSSKAYFGVVGSVDVPHHQVNLV